jgi:uncharacterized protein (DUF488 family)
MSHQIFTIGHSNHTIEEFIELLKQHGITAIADVRSHPHSRHYPQFNKSELADTLKKAGIRYVFLGRELGARPNNQDCYDLTGKALYERIAATCEFSQGIERLLNGVQSFNISLMCAEKDPITCHRTILVCQNLKKHGLTIQHILADGTIENHEALEAKLLEKYGLHQLSLFDQRSLEERLLEAYRRQGDKIAYVQQN